MDSIGNKAVNPKLAESAPNSTHHRIDAAIAKPEQPPNSRVVGAGIALGAPTQDAVCTGRIPDFPEQCVGKDGL